MDRKDVIKRLNRLSTLAYKGEVHAQSSRAQEAREDCEQVREEADKLAQELTAELKSDGIDTRLL